MAKRHGRHGKKRKHGGRKSQKRVAAGRKSYKKKGGLRSYSKSKSPAARAKRSRAARKAAKTRARNKKYGKSKAKKKRKSGGKRKGHGKRKSHGKRGKRKGSKRYRRLSKTEAQERRIARKLARSRTAMHGPMPAAQKYADTSYLQRKRAELAAKRAAESSNLPSWWAA